MSLGPSIVEGIVTLFCYACMEHPTVNARDMWVGRKDRDTQRRKSMIEGVMGIYQKWLMHCSVAVCKRCLGFARDIVEGGRVAKGGWNKLYIRYLVCLLTELSCTVVTVATFLHCTFIAVRYDVSSFHFVLPYIN